VHKGVQIIVATPGRLIDLIGRHKVDFSGLEMLVLDEADRMLHMGFLPDIEKIAGHLPKRRQTLMFSATFPKEVESLARRFQYQPKMVQIGKRSNPADTVDQCVYEVPAHLKNALLLELLRQPGYKRVLVFVRMKDGANRLTTFLQSARVMVARLHSSRSQEQRLKALQDFKDGKVQVLVATDIVARGIDIDGVTQVVNYDFPVNPEDYIHRIGRTGRAEAQGEAISFVPEEDLNLLGILELNITRRLQRKKLKGFNYHAPIPPYQPGITPPRRDWRKRTRELEAKKVVKPATPPSNKPVGKRRKP
jgi:ATP-dependent RNA helicase RhlE